MPRRNLLILFLAFGGLLLCYNRADRNRYVSTLADAMHLIDRRYVEEVPPRQLFEDAMRGLTEGLDPYSNYIPPTEYRQLKDDLNQEFGGIGIAVELNPDTKQLTVLSPLVNTPAYRAGIKAGDVILAIDGKDTAGLALRDCVALIQGKPGLPVRLSVLHAGEQDPVELTVERAIIPLESVLGDTRQEDGSWSFVLPEHPRITYVRIVTFGERTVTEVANVLKRREPIEALLIDLRDDAGGLFPAAVDVCRMFVSEGEIVSTRGRGGVVLQTIPANGKTLLDPQVPIAVLINHYSASASEVLAACLQDHGRAKIIGQRTWGKGTVQHVLDLEGGRSALKLTTATYWRPSGKNIHRHKDDKEDADWGVRPDPGFEVVLTDKEAAKVRKQRRQRDLGREVTKPEPKQHAEENEDEDDKANGPFEDTQLKKAIEYLESKLTPKLMTSDK
jgi:carboxyl-terminal processing protease